MSVIKNVLGLDVGDARIGVAVASTAAKIARPVTTISNDEAIMTKLKDLVNEHQAQALVVGLPRGLDGQNTAQTDKTQAFANQLKSDFNMPIYMQDEALTSKKAEEELKARNKPYAKEDIDALAATYILDDFMVNRADEV